MIVLAICPWSCVLVVVNPLPHTLCRFKSHSDADGNVSHVLYLISRSVLYWEDHIPSLLMMIPLIYFLYKLEQRREEMFVQLVVTAMLFYQCS